MNVGDDRSGNISILTKARTNIFCSF